MKCPSCNNPQPTGARFCGNCHASLQPAVGGNQRPAAGGTPVPDAYISPLSGRGAATASLVLGIIALMAICVSFPRGTLFFTLPLALAGLAAGLRGMNSSRRSQARLGVFLAIIGLLAGVVVIGMQVFNFPSS